jgi:CheY-like chemotaxis protein
MIALTGWGQEEDRRRTSDAGFDAHLIKPIDPVEVMRLIESRRQPRE